MGMRCARGALGVGLAQCDIHETAGGEAEPLGDEVQVVVVDPDRRKVIGHAQNHRVLRGFDTNHGLEPHLEHVLGKQLLEVAFDGFPETG